MGSVPAQLFEHINALLTFLSLELLFICARYFVIEYREHGFDRQRMHAAIAVGVMMFGNTLLRGWVWWLRHLQNRGMDSTHMVDMPLGLVPLIGTAVQVVGLLLMIRALAPDACGNRGWVVSGVLALAGTILAGWL
jgi:hypothetical protein